MFSGAHVFRVLLVLTGSMSVALAESPVATALRGFRPEALRAHMQFLASDSLEGRETGSRGFNLAAEYVATNFQLLGLVPAGEDKSYFQPIRFRSATLVRDKTFLKFRRQEGEETLAYGQHFISAASLVDTNLDLEGSLVFAGFGIVAPELNVDDYRGIDVRGKVVVVRIGAPAGFPVAERAYFGGLQLKREIARTKGAIGLILLRDEDADKRTPFATSAARSVFPVMQWLDPSGRPPQAANEVPLMATLNVEVGKRLLGAVDKPGPLPGSVSARIVSTHTDVTSANIAGVLPGSDPSLRNEYVIYTAHLDHLGLGPEVNGDRIYNGAQDNEAGVAGLLEIARAFAGMRPAPKRSVLFLVVTGEEKGSLGSGYFVEHPTVRFADIVANVNIEGLGLAFDFRDVVALGADYSTLGNVVDKAARRLKLEISPDWMPEQLFFTRSDQYSFVKRGIPAVFHFFGQKAVDPAIHARDEITGFLAKHYHQPSDDMTQPMNFWAGVKWSRFDFMVGYLVAQNPLRPTWKSDNFFGRTFGGAGRERR
jgi:hypothetical protein